MIFNGTIRFLTQKLEIKSHLEKYVVVAPWQPEEFPKLESDLNHNAVAKDQRRKKVSAMKNLQWASVIGTSHIDKKGLGTKAGSCKWAHWTSMWKV